MCGWVPWRSVVRFGGLLVFRLLCPLDIGFLDKISIGQINRYCDRKGVVLCLLDTQLGVGPCMSSYLTITRNYFVY